VLLTLIGILGAAISWSGANGGRLMLVATRELPAGSRLAPGDLAAVRVRLSDAMLGAAIPASEQGALIGRELAEPVHEQQLLYRAHLGTRPVLSGEQRAMTIPAGPDRAAGGLVKPGDQVMVLVTPRAPSDASAEVVLPQATVYVVGYDERAGAAGPASGGQSRRGPITSLTLLVSDGQALQLAKARARGDLDVALLAPKDVPAPAPAQR
jgi:Flp pilus assembly protein CpaB